MSFLYRFLLSTRPATLGAWLSSTLGCNQRRVVEVADGRFFVNPVSNFGYRLMTGASYEPETKRAIEDNLMPGATFIDLGANEGYFSIVASRVIGPSGRLITIEPQDRLQDIIRENFSLNNVVNGKVIQAVVSSHDGQIELELTPEVNTGASGLYRRTKYALPTQSVKSMTLRSVLTQEGIDHCDLLKIDIEGAEYDLVMESSDILSSNTIDCIVMEVHDSIIEGRGFMTTDLFVRMQQYGYSYTQLGDMVVFKRSKRTPTQLKP